MNKNSAKTLAFGASYCKESINKYFAGYAARQLNKAKITGTFSLPYFNEDFNPQRGILDLKLDNQFKYTISSVQKKGY